MEITLLFLTGQIKKPNGELYRAPHLTEAYRNLYEQKGLLNVRAESRSRSPKVSPLF